MAEDSVAEDGAAGAQAPAQVRLDNSVAVPEAAPSADAPIPVIEAAPVADAPPVPAPEPLVSVEGPAASAAARKADAFSVGASAIGHLLVGLLIIGSLASAQKPPDAIPVKLIPADQAPPPKKPPQHSADKKAPAPQAKATQQQQKQAAAQQQKPPAPPQKQQASPPQQQQTSPPPKTAAADPAKNAVGGEKAPAPDKTETSGEKKNPSWKDIAASLGMADFGRKTTIPATLLAELQAQAKRCWTVPSGWSDPRQVTITLRFQLDKGGALNGDPAVVEFPATPIGAAAAKAAIDAVKRCGPYHLPAAQYDQWKDIQLKLAP